MVNRKGVGYIIEAFVATIVVFIFIAGNTAVSNFDESQRYRDTTTLQDMTNVLKETGSLDRMVSQENTAGLKNAANGLTDGRKSISTSITGLPIEQYTIGFYKNKTNPITQSIIQVSSGDRCYGNLDIDSEYPIMRTSGGLENTHGLRLYITDEDQTSGYNGYEDYDTLYIDRGVKCEFATDEGPYSFDDFYSWTDHNESNATSFYEFEKATGDNITLYNATVAAKLNQYFEQSFNSLETKTELKTFNFTDNYQDYDILLFHNRDNLPAINSNSNALLTYLETGKAIFMMNLSRKNLSNGFLSKTGLEWVNLSYSKNSDPDYITGETNEEVLFENYLNGLGLRPNTLSYEIQSKTRSEQPPLTAGNYRYDTDKWNATNSSLKTGAVAPAGVEVSSCPNPHSKGRLNFTKDDEWIEVFNTKLGPGTCSNTYGIHLDTDKDGSYTDQDDEIYLNGDSFYFNGAKYEVHIYSQTSVDLEYMDDQDLELISYKGKFPSQDIGGFALMNNLEDGGQLGGTDDEEIKLAVATTYWMLDRSKKRGSEGSTISSTINSAINQNSYMPYSITLRWR